jgi:hypothetical protein
LPPLAGFLVAGFVHALGLQGGEALARVSDLGITLLLFTIGLKLDLASLLRREDRKLRIRQQYPSARRTATRALGILRSGSRADGSRPYFLSSPARARSYSDGSITRRARRS